MLEKLEEIERRHQELLELQADPEVAVDPNRSFLPDETAETDQTSWQTEELPDGNTHYVHLRAIDEAGAIEPDIGWGNWAHWVRPSGSWWPQTVRDC